jgi:hypothetical protein
MYALHELTKLDLGDAHMATPVTVKNIGRTVEAINGTPVDPGDTLVVDLDDIDVRHELRGDNDWLVLPDSAAGTLPAAGVASDATIRRQAYLYDATVDGGAIGSYVLKDLDCAPQAIPANALVFGHVIQPLVQPTSGGAATISVSLEDSNWGSGAFQSAVVFGDATWNPANTNWKGFLANGPGTDEDFAPLVDVDASDVIVEVAGASLLTGKFIVHALFLEGQTA